MLNQAIPKLLWKPFVDTSLSKNMKPDTDCVLFNMSKTFEMWIEIWNKIGGNPEGYPE